MIESSKLLAEYVANGSEEAFRELVARYINLVYSTALRLVRGDVHLAQDVTQTVFMHLSRNARKLSREVMLGGWLHRDACYTASKAIRCERRRQARERQAALMNSLQDHSQANLEKVAPLLDEAINRLGHKDRTAILLRFFEQRDFRSVGTALGSNEDAARMRVSRALEKLHAILKWRGVTLSAAALGTALAGEAVTAAPAGLAASVTTTVLAGSAAGGGISATLLGMMTMTNLKAGIVSAIVVAGVATSLVIQYQARARLREQGELSRRQSEQLAQLAADNERLAKLVAQANRVEEQLKDLPRLRAEAESLRQQTNGLAVLQEQNRRLQQPAAPEPKAPQQIQEEMVAKMNYEKQWLVAFIKFAIKNADQFPTNFEQAASFLPKEFKGQNNITPDQFEIVYHGSVTNAEAIFLREKQPWLGSDGKWTKIYGFIDGHVQVVSMPSAWTDASGRRVSYDRFEVWENDHMIPPSGP